MVLKNKHNRDRVKDKVSGLAKKKVKSQYKGHKKDNYKKKSNTSNKKVEIKFTECNICYETVEDTADNSIVCGGTKKHTICGDCKIKIVGSDCPMCRSHTVRAPVARNYNLPIYQKHKKGKSPHISDISRMSPKNIRNNRRSGPYIEPFYYTTNRIVRQRRQAARNPSITYGSTIYQTNSEGENIMITGNYVTIYRSDGRVIKCTRDDYEQKNIWVDNDTVRRIYNGVVPDDYNEEEYDEYDDSDEEGDYIYLTDIDED